MRRRSFLKAGAALALTTLAPVEAHAFASERISVTTRGTGPDIILIPGLTGHRDQWSEAAETLDDRYRLHLVQVNGFAGFAPGPNATGPVAAPVAEEVARYIAEAKLQRPAVIGHSMGGTIGMMLAARHPQQVGRLMVVDMMPYLGAVYVPGANPEKVKAAADQQRAAILASPPGGGMLGQMFPTMTLKKDKLPMLLDGLKASDKQTVANAFHELLVTDLRPELGKITAPMTVLYVADPSSGMTPAQFDAAMRDLYATAPRARLIRIDEARHFIQWDQPQRFLAEVDALMKL